MIVQPIPSTHSRLIAQLTDLLSVLPQVEAIALGGSLASGAGDTTSDIDLYVFTRTEIPWQPARLLSNNRGEPANRTLA